MRRAAHVMEALAERTRRIDEHGTDGGIGRRTPPATRGEFARAAEVDAIERGDYGRTSTPFQNATWPLICFAASLGSG